MRRHDHLIVRETLYRSVHLSILKLLWHKLHAPRKSHSVEHILLQIRHICSICTPDADIASSNTPIAGMPGMVEINSHTESQFVLCGPRDACSASMAHLKEIAPCVRRMYAAQPVLPGLRALVEGFRGVGAVAGYTDVLLKDKLIQLAGSHLGHKCPHKCW